MKGFVVVLVVEQGTEDRDAVARVCHEFEATSLGELEVAVQLAAKSAQRQVRRMREPLAQERRALARRSSIRSA